MTEPQVRPTEYIVSCAPEGSVNAMSFEITVARRGVDQWAVLHRGFCLGDDGEWSHEPRPSDREDEWKATHRFDLETALTLAKEHAPKVTVGPRRQCLTADQARALGWFDDAEDGAP